MHARRGQRMDRAFEGAEPLGQGEDAQHPAMRRTMDSLASSALSFVKALKAIHQNFESPPLPRSTGAGAGWRSQDGLRSLLAAKPWRAERLRELAPAILPADCQRYESAELAERDDVNRSKKARELSGLVFGSTGWWLSIPSHPSRRPALPELLAPSSVFRQPWPRW